jgi:hypothetical protein
MESDCEDNLISVFFDSSPSPISNPSSFSGVKIVIEFNIWFTAGANVSKMVELETKET